MKFSAQIKNKILVFNNKSLVAKYIQTLKDGPVEIKITPVKKPRSLNQNALYWEWLTIIGEELGYDTEELHTTFKSMFLTDRSQKLPIVRSTTMLSTLQFTQYLNKIERKVAELGIILPQPESYE